MNVFNRKTVDHFVSLNEKEKPDWYISTFDTLSGIAKSDNHDDLRKYSNMINGTLDKKEYNAFMNPFNFKDDRHKNIPGTLRNYDIVLKNLRKFIGEYITSYQEFHVISSIPDDTNQMLEDANQLAYELLSQEAMAMLQAAEKGEQYQPQDISPKVEEFKSKWKDNRVINDHNMLEFLKTQTEDAYIYAKAYFHWITYGCYFIERRVYKDDVIKEVIEPMNAYPIVTDADFVEDYEGFFIESILSITDIIANYSDEMDDKDKAYLIKIAKEGMYGAGVLNNSTTGSQIFNPYKVVEGITDLTDIKDFAPNLDRVAVGKLYYKGFDEVKILKYLDPIGNEFEMEVENDYELNPMIGDISLTSEWCPYVYVQYRFGSKTHGVYTKPKKIPVQRQEINNNYKVKLPVTGKVGIFPGFPNHSIPKILFPFQVAINLLELSKDRAIITAQGRIAVIPKELLGTDEIEQEEEMYNMLVIKKLFPNTSKIPNLATVIQAIRDIDLSDTEYIRLLEELIDLTKRAADDAIDMNRNRAGNNYASDGKGVNEEAITQISMGTAIINQTFDLSRCKDYEADIDYTKVAWADGKKGYFSTADRQRAFFEVNPIQHAETQYGIHVVNAFEYDRQKQELKDYAFSLGQNGMVGEDVILDVITNRNISKLKEILQIARTTREQREEQRFQQEQETRQVEAQEATKQAQIVDERERYKIDQDNITDLLIKEADITLKVMDMEQDDKNNEVLERLQESKQALQTQLSILHGR